MEPTQEHDEARPAFRCIAGIVGVLMLITGLPMAVIAAVSSDASMWFVAFPILVVGVGFVTLAITGRFLCFRRRSHDNAS